MTDAIRDKNFIPVALGVSTSDSTVTLPMKIDPLTGKLLVEGSGTVTSVSITTANGISGTVATATTTPAITLILGAITPTSISTAGQITSTIATGSAPFVVSSTTQVANLNVASAGTATNTSITDDTATNAVMYPTWVTATTGNLPQKISSTKLVFVPATGTLAATVFSGILAGTTTNDNAPTGAVGEYVSSTIATANKIALTSTVTSNVTSISLTAGDWDVTGVVDYVTGGATAIAIMQQGSSSTSATLGSQDTFSSVNLGATVTSDPANVIPITRISIASTTTIYLVANATFTVSTLSAYGTIRARRIR